MAKKQYLTISPYAKRNLPDGYTQALYIQSNGLPYIDSGFVPNQNTRVICDIEITQVLAGDLPIFGSRVAYNSAAFSVWTSNGQFYSDFGGDYNWGGTVAVGRYLIDKNKNVSQIGSTTITHAASSFTAPSSMAIGSCKTGSAATNANAAVKFYTFLVYDNGTLVRDYVPCYVDATGEYGLYDMVTQSFYGNKGTGAFGGMRIVELPEGYAQIEYIETSGMQYINTGVMGGENVTADFAIQATGATANAPFIANYGSNYNNCIGMWYAYSGYFLAIKNATTYQLIPSDNERHEVQYKGNTIVVDGTSFGCEGAVSVSQNFCLFCETLNGKPQTFSYYRLFSLRFYDNGVLVRDYIPCMTSAGVAGLYDTVNNVFYGSAGAGAFIAGQTVSSTFREVKKRYLSIGGAHRKVKKGYLTIGGTYRPFLGGGEIAYYGAINGLPTARKGVGGTSFLGCAIFAGGQTSSSGEDYTTEVTAYDPSLTRGSATALYQRRGGCAAATVYNACAIFVGGTYYTSSTQYSNSVDIYNTGWTRTSTTFARNLAEGAAASGGVYALFGGGRSSKSSRQRSVYAYDGSGARGNRTDLDSAAQHAQGAYVVGHSLIAGGQSDTSNSTALSTVNVYNNSGSKLSSLSMTSQRTLFASAQNDKYAAFAGGTPGGSTMLTSVDVFDASLTRLTPQELSVGRHYLTGVGMGEYLAFAGGVSGTMMGTYQTVVDVYDGSLTRSTPQGLSEGRNSPAGAVAGNFILFAGGEVSGNPRANVDAYTIV